jgi:hypothetical protein
MFWDWLKENLMLCWKGKSYSDINSPEGRGENIYYQNYLKKCIIENRNAEYFHGAHFISQWFWKQLFIEGCKKVLNANMFKVKINFRTYWVHVFLDCYMVKHTITIPLLYWYN